MSATRCFTLITLFSGILFLPAAVFGQVSIELKVDGSNTFGVLPGPVDLAFDVIVDSSVSLEGVQYALLSSHGDLFEYAADPWIVGSPWTTGDKIGNPSNPVEEGKALSAKPEMGYFTFGAEKPASSFPAVIATLNVRSSGSLTDGTYTFVMGDSGPGFFWTNSDGNGTFDSSEIFTLHVQQSISLIGAASRRQHGTSESFDISLPLSGSPAIEQRQMGLSPKVVLTFDRVPTAADGSIDCGDEVIMTNGTCNDVTVSGNDLIISAEMPENACTTVTLQTIHGFFGDNDVSFLTHTGNVNGDDAVNVIDLQQIKNHVFEPVSESNFKYDVNADGQINVIDLQETKNNIFTPLPSCD